MAKTKIKKPELLNESEVIEQALVFNSLNQKTKELGEEAGAIKEALKEYVTENGVTTPNGHIVFEKTHAGNTIKLENQMRVGTRLKSDALHTIKKTRHASKVIETFEDINLDKLEALHQKGVISDELFSSLFEENTTYAFSVKVKPSAIG